MSVNVMAPPIRAPRVSLLSSADVLTFQRDDGERWFGGIELYPLSGTDASGLWPVCPGENSEATKDAGNRIGGQRFQPFAIYATDFCSTYGSGAVDFHQRARDKLAVVESYWIEHELWEGTLGLNNPSFVHSPSTVLTAGPTDALMAFVEMDSAVADDLHDGRGMIHMPTSIFSWLTQYSVFRREGNVWLSPLDNIVVPGRGYTGNGPEGSSESADAKWIFGHPGTIQIARSEVTVLPESDKLFKQMSRPINDIHALAERTVGFVVSNGIGDDDGAAVTGFYAAEVDTSFLTGS